MCSTDGSGTLWTSGTDVICEFTCRSQTAHRNSGKEEQRDADYKEEISEFVNLILCIGYYKCVFEDLVVTDAISL